MNQFFSILQRTLKFIKYLDKRGYQSSVLCPNPKLIRSVKDRSLIKEMPSSTIVYKTFVFDLNWIFKILYGFRLIKLVRYIQHTLLFPDYCVQWLPFAKFKLRKILENKNPDIILITSPPHSIQKLAIWLKKITNIPVVGDFRDPIAFDNNISDLDLFRRSYEFEKKVLFSLDGIIANTRYNEKMIIKEYGIPENKITHISNGYDPDDLKPKNIDNRISGKTIITNIGRFYENYNALPVLKAINKIKYQIHNIVLRFIGYLTKEDLKYIKDNNLDTFIEYLGYCPHDKAIEYGRSSDYLLLIVSNPRWIHNIPGKTFEYLIYNKPIIGLVSDGSSVVEVINTTRTGFTINPEETDKIAEVLKKIDSNSLEFTFSPNKEEIKKYSRENLTLKLINFLEKISNEKSYNIRE
ncbi:hypothetical protein ES708_08083 [subsurface metagenome]